MPIQGLELTTREPHTPLPKPARHPWRQRDLRLMSQDHGTQSPSNSPPSAPKYTLDLDSGTKAFLNLYISFLKAFEDPMLNHLSGLPPPTKKVPSGSTLSRMVAPGHMWLVSH